MTDKPALPEGVELPNDVGRWTHAPGSNRNGHVWKSKGRNTCLSVAVYCGLYNQVRVKVADDRIIGLGGAVELAADDLDNYDTAADATLWGIQRAATWMRAHDPDDWTHPEVYEPAFEAPPGYGLDRYFIRPQKQAVYYLKEGTESRSSIAASQPDTDPSIDTRRYLVLTALRGSGNSTVSVAPWTAATNAELAEIIELPDDSGIAIAHKRAREYVLEHTDTEQETQEKPAVGQSDLSAWSSYGD
jgi:hypothetical protein